MIHKRPFKITSFSEKQRIRELEQEMEIKNEIISVLEGKSGHLFSHHKNKELQQENQMFKELLESIEGKISIEKEQFLSMISHELKTPLVPVQGYAKMLKEEVFGHLDEIQKQKLGIIDSNTNTLIHIIQNILDFQKISSGSMEMKIQRINLEKIANEVFASLSLEFVGKDIKKTILVDSEIVLECDLQRITQVVTNLVDNSLKSIQGNSGEIKVVVSQDEKTVTVSVKDNGCGIAEEHQGRIFSKFYQVDMSNTREKGGIGLGLAICKKIVDAHGGKIWVESQIGNGTSVNFTLPKNHGENFS